VIAILRDIPASTACECFWQRVTFFAAAMQRVTAQLVCPPAREKPVRRWRFLSPSDVTQIDNLRQESFSRLLAAAASDWVKEAPVDSEMRSVDDHLSHQTPVPDTVRVLDESLGAIPCRTSQDFILSGHVGSGGCGQVSIQSSVIAAMHASESMPSV
jgi:hypothetical protein